MTPAEALAALVAIKDNQMALADPVSTLWAAEIAFKQAVVEALQPAPILSATLTTDQITNLKPGGYTFVPASQPNPDLVALQAENAALAVKVQAGDKAIDAIEAMLHPVVDAAPSSSEPATIAPVTPGA